MPRPIRCPACRKEVPLGASTFPFCSERCRITDLGRWASEEYRVPVVSPAESTPPRPESQEEPDE